MAPLTEEKKQDIRDAWKSGQYVSHRQLAKAAGVHRSTVDNVLDGVPKPPSASELDLVEDAPEGNWRHGKNWVYNGDTETYILYLKCRPNPLIIGKSKMTAMKRAYSNWDKQEATINEICRRFSIPRDQFMELKASLGWTHDQEPFTAEEVSERSVEDLAQDALQQKRQALFEGFQKEEWQQTKKDAEKWNKLEQSFILPLQEFVQTFAPSYTQARVSIAPSRRPFAVVTNTGELHYGKAGWVSETGHEYGRDQATERLLAARTSLLEEISLRGVPEKFILAVGNDYLHIDNEHGTTSKGTPQDCDGTAARVYMEGFELAIRDIDTLLAVAPVQIIRVPGNHDHLLTLALLKGIQAWYRKDSRVEIIFNARSRDYTVYGNTLLGFAHGDGNLKPKDFMATMAKEATEWWSRTKHKAFFTGHLHSEVVRELIGGTHYQMKSLSGSDRYHEKNAYLSEAGMNSYILDREKGITSSIVWNYQ